METRWGHRRVSTNAANGQLPPMRGFPGTRSGKPHARDPPLVDAAQRQRGTQRARHGSPVRGRPPRGQGRKRKEAMRATSPLPVGLAKLVPVTASYLTW